jgi:preprotein translocase subunit SecG
MITFLAIIHIIACLGLIALVLVQDSKGGGVFTSQASSNSVLGATGATSLAQTMTKVVATIFAVTCITLSILSARSEKSVVDTGAPGPIPTTTSTANGLSNSAGVSDTKVEAPSPQTGAAPQPVTNEKK